MDSGTAAGGPTAGPTAALVDRLRAAGCVFAEDEARLLAEAADGDGVRLEILVRRRIGGEPLETVLGWAEFCGLRIGVRPGVFVPRRRTEFLAELAADALRHASAGPVAGPVADTVGDTIGDTVGGIAVDLCCGTAAIGVVLAERLPAARVYAGDLDPVAVACATDNLAGFGPRASAQVGDLYDALPSALRGRVDVLAVNAPYVPTGSIASMPREARDSEPVLALDGGPDGVDVHRRVAAGAGAWLAPGGVVLIETGRAQASVTAAALRAVGLTPSARYDEDRDATVVVGIGAAARRSPTVR